MNEIKQEPNNGSGNMNFQAEQNENDYQNIEGEQYSQSENNYEYIPNMSQGKKDKRSPFVKRIIIGASVIFAVGILSIFGYNFTKTSTSVNNSAEAGEAITTHMSTSLPIGAKLMDKDDHYIGGDMTITHSSQSDDNTLYVWDYAAVDGDYVQVFVDGVPLGDPFMIKNEAVSFKVPAVGEIKVVGTRDGGGGITYGVYYDVDQTTYFNGMDQGGSNVYTLVRE